MIKMINPSNIKRFEIDNLIKKGFRIYNIEVPDKDKEQLSKIIYHRYGMDNFYIGKTLLVKNTRNEV